MDRDSNILPQVLQPPDPKVRVRPVHIDDLIPLRCQCWSHYSMERARDILIRARHAAERGIGIGLVVMGEYPQDIIGYGQWLRFAHCAEISDLIVAEPYRGSGIGTALLQHLTRHAFLANQESVEIGASSSNLRALSLYRRIGFVEHSTADLNFGSGRETVIYLRMSAAALRR